MRTNATATEILNREFLELRHRLLDLAAGFDRIDRGRDRRALRGDPRMQQLVEAASVLLDDRCDRTERVQMIFSDPFEGDEEES